jgi:hypothetical protein
MRVRPRRGKRRADRAPTTSHARRAPYPAHPGTVAGAPEWRRQWHRFGLGHPRNEQVTRRQPSGRAIAAQLLECTPHARCRNLWESIGYPDGPRPRLGRGSPSAGWRTRALLRTRPASPRSRGGGDAASAGRKYPTQHEHGLNRPLRGAAGGSSTRRPCSQKTTATIGVHAVGPITRHLTETKGHSRLTHQEGDHAGAGRGGRGGGALPMSGGSSFQGRRKPNGSACHRRTMAGVQDEAKHAMSAMSPLKSCDVEKPQPQR